MTIEDFEVVNEIGKGAYSVVNLVRQRKTGRIFAMKRMAKERVASFQEGIRVRTERAVMLHFNSSFIVKLYYVFQDDVHLYFVMDYAAGGDLSHLLNQCGSVPESWARRWFAQMVQAVMLLHGVDVNSIMNANT